VLQIVGIDHIVLRVRDLERMTAFYCDVLGCSVERRREDLGMVHLRAGRSLIDLVDVDGTLGRAFAGPADASPALDHFALRVERFDAAALRADLSAAGFEVSDARENFGAEGDGPSVYLGDPEGNRIELKGPPSAPRESGPGRGSP
jgi:glyoxylase I family protein